MEHLPEWFPAAGGVALILFGLVAGVWSLSDIKRARVARDWPVADGLVIQSALEAKTSGGDRFEKHRFRYRYEVDGREYTGKRIKAGGNFELTIFGGGDHAWSTARDLQSRYPLGTEVAVLHDPVNPKDCCLEPGGMFCALMQTAVSLGIALAGVYVLVNYS
jgi:hypothetical protein